MRQYPRKSSSVARQNQGVKQLRKRRTVLESLMDGRIVLFPFILNNYFAKPTHQSHLTRQCHCVTVPYSYSGNSRVRRCIRYYLVLKYWPAIFETMTSTIVL